MAWAATSAGLTYDVTSPGIIYKNLIILGSMCGEGPEPAAPGHIRAFDVRTGVMAWIFHTLPRPGEFGNDAWQGDSWRTTGGANDWGGMTLDEKRGWVFVSTGSAAFDFYGGQRLGSNLFANCVIALDAATGKRIWHYQVVHHDLWDRDLPCPACPGDAQYRRQARGCCRAAHQVRPAFRSRPRNRHAPVPDGRAARATLGCSRRTSLAHAATGAEAAALRPPSLHRRRHHQYLAGSARVRSGYLQEIAQRHLGPPSLQGTIVFPGFDGGSNWGGGSFDPTTGWYYINSHDEPWIMTLVPAPEGAGYPYSHTGYNHFVDQEGYAAIKPPWGQLTAFDLNRGEIAWQVVLGEFKELTARGIPPTGTQNIGGSIVTAGGIVFIGSTQDEMFRAFDKTNGKLLWEAQLPAGGYATPCTYEAGGKQYVVIAAGGGGKPRTRSGDAYVAFALP